MNSFVLRRARRLQHRLRVCALSVFALVSLVTSVIAQDIATELKDADRGVMSALLGQMGGEPSPADIVLRELGFDPGAVVSEGSADFRHWPDLRKLEFAYRAAVSANGEAAGTKFLRRVSRQLAATRSNAIRYEPALRQYFPEPETEPIVPEKGPLSFKRPPLSALAHAVSPELQKLLLTVTKYAARTPGGMPPLLAACCALKQSEIYRILSTSGTNADALAEALRTSAIPPSLRAKLTEALRHVAERNHSFRYEKVFSQYLSNESGDHLVPQATIDQSKAASAVRAETFPESAGPLDAQAAQLLDQVLDKSGLAAHGTDLVAIGPNVDAATAGAGAGLEGPAHPQSSTNQDRFVDRANEVRGWSAPDEGGSVGGGGGGSGIKGGRGPGAPGGGLSFHRIIGMGGGGFGGVVFGNELTTPKDRALARVSWMTEDATSPRPFGRFEFAFSDGTTGYSALLPADLADAAYVLVYEGFEDVVPPVEPRNDDAAPLAGVASRADAISIPRFDGENGYVLSEKAPAFVVHPAIDRTALGYSAVLADGIPFLLGADQLLTLLREAGVDDDTVAAASAWRSADKGFYKIIDAPLVIAVQPDGYVDVSRANGTRDYSLEIRTVALLTMLTFKEDPDCDPEESICPERPADEFATPFYETVPALVGTFPPFADLNMFAETFAIARWAKMDSAKWDHLPPNTKRGPGLHYVRSGPDGLTLFGTATLAQETRTVMDEADKHARELAEGAPAALSLGIELSKDRRGFLSTQEAVHRLQSLVAKTTDAQDRKAAAVGKLEAEAAHYIDVAEETLKPSSETGAEIATPDDLRALDQLNRLNEERSDLLWQKEALASFKTRFEAADGPTKMAVNRLIEQIDTISDELFNLDESASNEELEVKRKAIETLEGKVDALLPKPDASQQTSLDAKINDLSARREAVESTYNATSKDRVERFHRWHTLQSSATRALTQIFPPP